MIQVLCILLTQLASKFYLSFSHDASFFPLMEWFCLFNIYHSPTFLTTLRNTACHMQHLIWVCLEFWKLDYLFSYKYPISAFWRFYQVSAATLETFTKEMSASFRAGHPLLSVYSFRWDALGAMRDEGYHSVHQISKINPSDQWADRCPQPEGPHIQFFTIHYNWKLVNLRIP